MRITSSVSLNAKRIQLYEVRRNSSKVSLSTWTAELVLLCNKALFVCFLRCLRLAEKNKHALQTMRSFESESESHSVVSDSATPGLYSPWNSPGQNTGVGNLSLLQGIFPTQGLNPGLSYCRWILYQLSQKGSPRVLEWESYPFSSRSSWPRNQTGVSCIAGRFFTNWAMSEAYMTNTYIYYNCY